jgi:hypothetical protein
MSDQPAITMEFVGRQLLAMSADLRDVKQRVTNLEARFTVIENRFTGLESRIGIEKRMAGLEDGQTGMMDLLVHLAMRIGVE